jgi:hypothetical protein
MADARPTALRFYGVIDADGATQRARDAEPLTIVQFRDLAAVVTPVPYVRVHPGNSELEDYVHVIDELYTHGPVIPAPPGTIFRNADVLRRWLEIHYAKLHETLGQVEQRPSETAPYDFIQMELGA